MIQWMNVVGKPQKLVEKLNEEGLTKDNIVQILVKEFDSGLTWYTVIYEVDTLT